MKLSEADYQRIADAVAAAEATTDGEIYCALATGVSDYREVPLAWAAGAALVLPLGVRLAGLLPDANSYAAVQAVVFLLAALIVTLPAVRLILTPGSLKAERVHRAAMAQFLAKGVHLTRARTGVLLFASAAERRAEVIADEGIYAAAPKEVWDEVVQLLTAGLGRQAPADGFVAAVKRAGEILAAHVPPTAGSRNELPDRPVELP